MILFQQSVQPFWIWFALTCLFLAVEVIIVPTGFFLCMGTAAGAVALATLVFPALPWLWALALFAALTVLAVWVWWALVRKRFSKGDGERETVLNVKTRQLVGYRSVLTEDIRAGKGKLRINDSPWLVEADEDYPAGTRVEVVDVTGITLKIKAVEK